MLQNTIKLYSEIVGDKVTTSLLQKIRKLKKRKVLNINSTFLGGGVAEILHSYIPLSNQFGMNSEWRVLHGTLPFYNISKKIHNGLQGEDINLSASEKEIYEEVNKKYSNYTRMLDHNFVIVHDPQPLPLRLISQDMWFNPTVWRCHVDLSAPNIQLLNYLKQFINYYNLVIVSREEYKCKDICVEQRVISPAIDPLSPKNRYLSETTCQSLLEENNIPTDKPIISQISRMDKWKDPEGLLEVYELVRKKVDCRLVYCYNSATDDPEGEMILQRIKEKAKDYIKRGDVILVVGDDPILVNALQTYSDVIVQKSTKEGFCLSVTEALWKGTPVVASKVGGIPSQVIDGQTGFLVDPQDFQGFADRIELLLEEPTCRRNMTEKAKEFVKERFLLTRLLDDYLNIFLELS